MDLLQLLRRSPVFSRLDEAQLDTLARAFAVDEYAEGHVFIREGERDRALYLLVQGEVEVTHRGVLRELTRLRPGALFGLMALLDESPRSATCRAASDCKVATLPQDAVARLLADAAPLACAFERAVAAQLAKDFRHVDEALRAALKAQASTEKPPDPA